MQYVPGGALSLGDARTSAETEALADERPAHPRSIGPFYMENLEVTLDQWTRIRDWGLTNGYTDLATGQTAAVSGPATNHPVVGLSWYDAVKWCNARSEFEGLNPVYRETTGGPVYRTGVLDLAADAVDATANGYRLPTEVEWEWAARGGLSQRFFPWGGQDGSFSDHIGATDARFASDGTAEAGSYAANGFFLRDMSGNAAEWCGDWFDPYFYDAAASNGPAFGPAGPVSGDRTGHRVARGGSWRSEAGELRCSFREPVLPSAGSDVQGLRVVRSFAPNASLDVDGDGMPDWWEYAFFGTSTGAVATANTDGDNLTEVEEYWLNLDPTNALSRFSITDAQAATNFNVVGWPSISTYTYRVWSTDSMLTNFLPFSDIVTGAPPVNLFTDTPPEGVSNRFYRVEMIPPPPP